MAYAKVARGALPADQGLREIDTGINDFLGDHITELRKITATRRTPPGQFIDSEMQALFRDLYIGADEEFLAAADTLTKRLISRMDGRTSPGLLICLRAQNENDRFGGVLKLQVVAEHAAKLDALDSGEVKLSAVSQLLDKPGELQKGALSTSSLAEERIMVGDRLAQDSAYFPEAFGIKIFSRPAAAVSDLFSALAAVRPELTEPVARALPRVPPGEPRTVLSALGQQVPELTEDIQADVIEDLENRPRPVGYIDTDHQITETIKVGGITISGPVSEMRQRVHTDQNNSEQWIITIESNQEPRRTHR
jgi:hypothetical protein